MFIRPSAVNQAAHSLAWCMRIALPLMAAAHQLVLPHLSSARDGWCLLLLGCVAVSASRRIGGADTKQSSAAQLPAAQPPAAPDSARASPPASGGDMLVLLPPDLYAAVATYLLPRDLSPLAVVSSSHALSSDANPLWRALWYRDYGHVLLSWDVGRNCLARSLGVNHTVVDAALARRFDSVRSVRHLYHAFGETYADYLTARRNSTDHCLLAMHGHIFDFTAFAPHHPGLTEGVLEECGRDATSAFENFGHSIGARRLADRLCVVANAACLPGDGWGLRPVRREEGLGSVLRGSNTRPPGGAGARYLPRPPYGTGRRPPALAMVRAGWDRKIEEEENKLRVGFWGTAGTRRTYYDPIRDEFVGWDAKDQADMTPVRRSR
mmetsp:Transcript_2840/g.5917  ORF Transcript_2840/g.5917 Transcript_2840/m.5917 type:complete len:380 (+) Transcript_2840:105-1244(+)